MLVRHSGFLQTVAGSETVAGNPEKAGSMPQPQDLAALNSLRCSLILLLILRDLSSIVVNMCFSDGAFGFIRGDEAKGIAVVSHRNSLRSKSH